MPLVYNIADIFVLPSYYEGLPTVVLEAMASQLPIVASNVGGVPYIINKYKCGILVSPGDVKGLANALIELIENRKLRKEMALRSAIGAKDFDWNIIVKLIERVYFDLLRNSQ